MLKEKSENLPVVWRLFHISTNFTSISPILSKNFHFNRTIMSYTYLQAVYEKCCVRWFLISIYMGECSKFQNPELLKLKS